MDKKEYYKNNRQEKLDYRHAYYWTYRDKIRLKYKENYHKNKVNKKMIPILQIKKNKILIEFN